MAPAGLEQTPSTASPVYGPLVVAVRNALPEEQPVVALEIALEGQKVFGVQAQGSGSEWEPAIEPGATRLVWEEKMDRGLVSVQVRASVREGAGHVAEVKVTREIEVPRRAVGVLVELVMKDGRAVLLVRSVPLAELQAAQEKCTEEEQGDATGEPAC